MPRKHRHNPALLTRAQVAAMIAAAVAAERERNDRIMVRISLALGDTYKVLDQASDAIVDHAQKLDTLAGLVGPMAEVLVAGLDLADAAETAAEPN